MNGTYKTEEQIDANRRHYQTGKIGERFYGSLKDVPLRKKYDLITGHYGLGYLTDNQLREFLKRTRVNLIQGRPQDKPGIMIFKEPIV